MSDANAPSPEPGSEPGSEARPRPPAPLVVAASLAAVQGMVLLLLAVLEIAAAEDDRRSLGLSTGLFFAGYGVVVLVGGIGLLRGSGWARGPVLLTQLILLGIAWSLRDTPVVAAGLAVVAALTLGGMLHPDTIATLSGRREGGPEDAG